jgi:hypothetical protein
MHRVSAAAFQRSESATRASADNGNCLLSNYVGNRERTEFDEMPNGVRDVVLLFLGEGVPPISEFVCELDFPRRTHRMPIQNTARSMTHAAG